MADSRGHLLQPTLSTGHAATSIYSVRSAFLLAFFGGPLAITFYSALNSRRLGRLAKDMPFYAAAILIVVALVYVDIEHPAFFGQTDESDSSPDIVRSSAPDVDHASRFESIEGDSYRFGQLDDPDAANSSASQSVTQDSSSDGYFRYVLRGVALAFAGCYYLLHRKHYRAMDVSGIKYPSPWVPALATIVAGFASTVLLIAVLHAWLGAA